MSTAYVDLDSFSESQPHGFVESQSHAREKGGVVVTESLAVAWYKSASLPYPGATISIYSIGTWDYLTDDEVSPYLYGDDGFYRVFLNFSLHRECTPDPNTGTDYTSAGNSNEVNQWTSEQTATSETPHGSGYFITSGIPEYSRSVSISDTGGGITATITETGRDYAGGVLTDFTQVTTCSLSGAYSVASLLANLAALYAEAPALATLGPAGGAYYRAADGSLTTTAYAGPGLDSGDFPPLGFGLAAGLASTIYMATLTGAMYAVTAQNWYVRSISYDIHNNRTADMQTQEAPLFGGLFALEPGEMACAQAYLGTATTPAIDVGSIQIDKDSSPIDQ